MVRSPESGAYRIATYKSDVNSTGQSQQLSFADKEEEEMNRAISASIGESRTLPDQETGVLDHDQKYFGPATRESYDANRWSMVRPGAQTHEILLNPEPIDRKRQKGTPAFIKPSPNGYSLPALVKILHAIPMAREALLNRSQTLPDYGHDDEWWDGTAAKVLRIVNVDSDGRHITADDIIYETQRLMAFLDETDRAYGSIDVLANLEGIRLYEENKVKRFFEEWRAASATSALDAPLADIFESIGVKTYADDMEPPENERFFCVAVRVEEEFLGENLTLYDALDDMLWGTSNLNENTWLDKVGDVVTFEVCNMNENETGLGIGIPATWYPDRYLPSCKQQAIDMRARKATLKSELKNIAKVQRALTTVQSPTNKIHAPAFPMLAKTTAYLEQTGLYRRDGLTEKHQDLDNNLTSAERLTGELKTITENLTRKLKCALTS